MTPSKGDHGGIVLYVSPTALLLGVVREGKLGAWPLASAAGHRVSHRPGQLGLPSGSYPLACWLWL